MIYWHILVLTYTFETKTFESTIAFRDQVTCANAMDEIYPTILAAYPDSMAQCHPTEVASGWKTRPKMRPWK